MIITAAVGANCLPAPESKIPNTSNESKISPIENSNLRWNTIKKGLTKKVVPKWSWFNSNHSSSRKLSVTNGFKMGVNYSGLMGEGETYT